MEGGNGASEANGITHSPTGEQNAAKCAYPNDEAENLPWMASVSGAFVSLADYIIRSQQPFRVADEVRRRNLAAKNAKDAEKQLAIACAGNAAA